MTKTELEKEDVNTCSVCKTTDLTYTIRCPGCKRVVCEFCELLYCSEGYHAEKE
jgi:hypothetical protein